MYPIICNIGPLRVYSYGLMLVAAFLVASFLASRQAKEDQIDPDIIFNLLFIVFISGIIGSRIFYVIENAGYYYRNPLEIIMLQKGGLSWFGGLILGGITGVIYLKNKKLPLYKVLDLLAPYLALGQAIGRIGCLLNGCCYGKESKFGIYFPVHEATLIPTQGYSTLALLAIYIILRALQKRKHALGEVFLVYLLLYSLKRFLIEFWRADNPVIFGGLTLFQFLSLAVFLFAARELFFIHRKKA